MKHRLTELVRQSKEENEVLGKVMERITKDYEDLKRQQQQASGGASFQAKSLPEDAVKIQVRQHENMKIAFDVAANIFLIVSTCVVVVDES